ncbi:hypothetical protein NDU88_003570 [Pleurodeles waltl]|uniref:Uncharacterized protein n=1 Tax=Pleurodeles waltl TaxID=8319 RepID=A0AAV7PF08_PLEWA|nr:hypothetical protein NDU88_003570 [Pleurodeles waltl]
MQCTARVALRWQKSPRQFRSRSHFTAEIFSCLGHLLMERFRAGSPSTGGGVGIKGLSTRFPEWIWKRKGGAEIHEASAGSTRSQSHGILWHLCCENSGNGKKARAERSDEPGGLASVSAD